MKLTVLKGIAHNLAHHIDSEICHGIYKEMYPMNREVLQQKSSFDRMCVEFFKERIPENFDFNKIKSIQVNY